MEKPKPRNLPLAFAAALAATAPVSAALLALTGAIFAEMIGGQTGLGVDLMRSLSTLDSGRAFALAILVWTLAIVLTLPFAILRWLFGRALRG